MSRIDRSRHEDQLLRRDLVDRPLALAVARQLVQIYDGGAMPTTTPAVYLGHPVQLGSPDCEGCSYTTSVNTDVSISVVVIGKVPSAGDLLVAHAIGGRWVSEGRTGTGGGFDCFSVCLPCSIPKTDLNLHWTTNVGGSGDTPLHYNGSIWTSGFILTAPWYGANLTVGCVSGTLYFKIDDGSTNYCDTGGPFGNYIPTLSISCNPLTWVLNMNQVGCVFVFLLYTTFTITGPVDFDGVHFLCCTPCPIPKLDLTLTISGTPITLTYSSSNNTWSDGTHTLACTGGNVALIGDETWTLSTGNTCVPLHLVFTSGGATAYVDE